MKTTASKLVVDFPVTVEDLQVDRVLQSQYTYDQNLVKLIIGQKVKDAVNFQDVQFNPNVPVKIEGYEKLSPKLFQSLQELASARGHKGPVTCHLFISPGGSLSFPMHTDPDDVIVTVLEGSKEFIVACETVLVEAGEFLFIPRETPHMACNVEDSLMLSIGFELFMEDKL